jgi:hypothetical protein
MENELEDGTRATFISQSPQSLFVSPQAMRRAHASDSAPGAGGLQPQLIHPGRRRRIDAVMSARIVGAS